VSDLLERIADAIEGVTRRIANAAAWLQPALVLVLVFSVTLRYGFGRGSIELEELQWHLFAATVLRALAGVYAEDAHVRVDLLHARFAPRTRAWVELAGALVLLLPFALILTFWGWDFFLRSWQLGERSPMPSGLPARWAIKGVMFAGFALLALQAVAVAARSLRALTGRAGR
jgi:TRAP-type mannitol/chloroaromatic compound transport system permease small subunit